MQQIRLAHTGPLTTRLGYGCSSIMGALSRRESLALLEAACDSGIRHFDVAPMYGFGAAEGCLGEFIQHHRSHVTVATKYGIPPARNRSILAAARKVAAPFIKKLPAVKRRLAGVANSLAHTGDRAAFTPEEANSSLERSLRELRTERIDLWLLHEVDAHDLQDDRLLHTLEDAVKAGKIGSFGIGSSSDKVPALLTTAPTYCPVLQFEWSILDPTLPRTSAFRIHHRALSSSFRALHSALLEEPTTGQRWSETVGVDLRNRELLGRLMLKASLERNPESIILFSSRSPAHLAVNAGVIDDSAMAAPALRLHELIQREGIPRRLAPARA